MTNDALLVAARNTFDSCLALLGPKGEDYARPHDAFSAFRLADNLRVCTVEQAMFAELCKKFARLANLRESGTSNFEGVDGTIHDLINYLAMYKELRREG